MAGYSSPSCLLGKHLLVELEDETPIVCCGKHTTPGQPKKMPTLVLPTKRPDTEETPATRPWLQPHPGVSQAHLKTMQLAMFLFLMAPSCPTTPFISLWSMVRQDPHTAVTLHLHPQTRALPSQLGTMKENTCSSRNSPTDLIRAARGELTLHVQKHHSGKGTIGLFSTEATTAEQWEQSLGSVQCLQRQRSSPMRWDQSKSPGSSIFHQSIITSTRYAPHKILQEPHCLARTLDTYVPLLRVQTTEKVQQSWKVKCI